ncbi:MAG TPA: hypothetical protein EYG03_17765 [Planctomycetes bacterium]|nr:hypothetical protein [Fuerstiella sp.]HIK93798.1 hypothetical protein [Planctomycetota bacterium]
MSLADDLLLTHFQTREIDLHNFFDPYCHTGFSQRYCPGGRHVATGAFLVFNIFFRRRVVLVGRYGLMHDILASLFAV